MYASTVSFFGNKACFIDQADFLPKQAQTQLLANIDEFSRTSCCFIVAANKPSILLPAIQSRLLSGDMKN